MVSWVYTFILKLTEFYTLNIDMSIIPQLSGLRKNKVCSWHRDRYLNKWNRKRVDPSMWKLVLTKVLRQFNKEITIFYKKGYEKTVCS